MTSDILHIFGTRIDFQFYTWEAKSQILDLCFSSKKAHYMFLKSMMLKIAQTLNDMHE